jgi:hypothetical protein
MNTQGGISWFFRWMLLLVVVVQLVACGTGSDTPAPVETAPAITSANNTIFTEGSAGTFTVAATGNPTPTLALTGALPTGVTFTAATGVLSGTPAAGSHGTYPLTITAGNGISPDATQNFILAVVTASTAALIVHDGTAGVEADVLGNLTTIMAAAGLTVTANVGIPAGDLSGYAQIWDIRYTNATPLTAGDITSYTTYLAAGRTLVVIGENTAFATRNNSIVTLISDLGGGSITVTTPNNAQTVQSPFTGPASITSITFLAAGGTTNAGTGTFITKDVTNNGAAIYYARGTLTGAPAGRLMVVFDINFLESSADATSHSLIGNMVRLP